MPKQRTHKAAVKRFKITKNKKFIARTAGQGHFNARESSKTTVGKRRDHEIAKQNVKALRRVIPYYNFSS